jgi:molybdopterin-containing oxidoreductase family iron-sulfur binding subunit
LRLLLPPTVSPTVVRTRAALAQRFPHARVHTWSAVADSNVREGVRIAIGQVANPVYSFDNKARVILSLDSDFLQTESGNVRATKLFALGRRMRSSREQMSRLYVVEPSLTTTGANADHRLRLPASEVESYAHALAMELAGLGLQLGEIDAAIRKHAKPLAGVSDKWLKVVAKDLVASRGHSVIVVGSRQPPALHALAHTLNALLGNVGQTVMYAAVADSEELDAASDVKALTEDIVAGKVDSLVILGGNPVYDAPADLAFAGALPKVPFSVHASAYFDETSEKCTWHVPLAHAYESWGDARALDGTIAVQQPLIAPLFGGRSDIELLLLMADTFAPEKTAYDAVRASARDVIHANRGRLGCGPFNDLGKAECHDAAGNPNVSVLSEVERDWSRALATGMVRRGSAPVAVAGVKTAEVAAAIEKQPPPAPGNGLEVTFAPCPKVVDGRHANNTWLQELPDPMTKLVWDNAALVSQETANSLGIKSGDLLRISAGDRAITIAAWVAHGQADRSIGLTLGWGRKKAGRIGNSRGFDVYPLRTTRTLGFATGVQVTKQGGEPYFFSRTQGSDTTDDRPIVHATTLADYRQRPNFAELDAPPPRALPLWSQRDYSQGHQWGMSIDLNACTGCNACAVACMSENNVPVVGKLETWRGRSMHWLRIDRYFVEKKDAGATGDDALVVQQPVMCQHCEEAPCENVCPVNATTHGPEGLNEMAYNRCIGTRYCANNCPYKVRRFNYLNWHNDSVWKETGGLPETLQMQQNPNVTVRFRGVIEKCTYCVQRIQSAKIRAKREYRTVHDNEIRTACQQTCPADAIVFGDLNEPNSVVAKLSRIDRRYGLLAELGTRPRTTYLGKIRNPNPEMGA